MPPITLTIVQFSVCVLLTFLLVSHFLSLSTELELSNSHTKALETFLSHATHSRRSYKADLDVDCPFRNSSIYRRVYVYPTPGDAHWNGRILSKEGHSLPKNHTWPWFLFDMLSRESKQSHYDIEGQHVQYTTELLVREIMTHPKSCLRTNNPDEAVLFYVPYLPSMEFHRGSKKELDYSTSPYGQAIMDILHAQRYDTWEQVFGLTADYWKRRNGSDHILVFSEPMHGLWHPRNKRGNFHYIRSQKQIAPPIVVSVELSTTFVQQYPACARKNILMPYPNTNGRWFNGQYRQQAADMLVQMNHLTTLTSNAALPADQELARAGKAATRPAALFYAAGNHGTCSPVRRNLERQVRKCSNSYQLLHKNISQRPYHGMWLSTFCPAPGGDSPSAKRMFDACLAGCIPVVLSHDFVWPFTNEFDNALKLDPSTFSLRITNVSDFERPLMNYKTCKAIDPYKPGIEGRLRAVSSHEIERLRKGVQTVAELYSWYRQDAALGDNPLHDRVLPNGGAAHAFVEALEERAGGVRWPACQKEYEQKRWILNDVKGFKC